MHWTTNLIWSAFSRSKVIIYAHSKTKFIEIKFEPKPKQQFIISWKCFRLNIWRISFKIQFYWIYWFKFRVFFFSFALGIRENGAVNTEHCTYIVDTAQKCSSKCSARNLAHIQTHEISEACESGTRSNPSTEIPSSNLRVNNRQKTCEF